MRTVIQRVQKASVSVEGKTVSSIGNGLLLLLGIEAADTEEDAQWLCRKVLGLRIFDDEAGVMNRSIMDIDGEIRSSSQMAGRTVGFNHYSKRIFVTVRRNGYVVLIVSAGLALEPEALS